MQNGLIANQEKKSHLCFAISFYARIAKATLRNLTALKNKKIKKNKETSSHLEIHFGVHGPDLEGDSHRVYL